MICAFYAPMKSPYHVKPSGDREIAKLILKALKLKYIPIVASENRTWEGKGNKSDQLRIEMEAKAEADNIYKKYLSLPITKQPKFWLTYHLYHKSPDWIGPYVSKKLGIPYFVVEASYAKKQESGLWSDWLEQSKIQIQQADKIFCFHDNDMKGLSEIVCDKDKLTMLKCIIFEINLLFMLQKVLRRIFVTQTICCS